MDIDQVPNLDVIDEVLDAEGEMLPISGVVERLKAQKTEGDLFPTGIKNFDEIIMGGIGEGDLVLISGRTGQGKTTFAQTIGMNLSNIGIPQAWFSYEITISELWKKFQNMGASAETFTGYAPTKLASGNVQWIENRIQESVLKNNVKVVFIDHLGFLTPKITTQNATEFERNYPTYLGQLTRQLKQLAMENKITIVLLTHTRKTRDELDVEDIAHSGGIAQESDFVFLVERIKNSKASKSDAWDEAGGGGIEVYTNFSKVKLVKNRRTGYTRAIKLEFKDGQLQEIKPHNVAENITDYVV